MNAERELVARLALTAYSLSDKPNIRVVPKNAQSHFQIISQEKGALP
jgi:formyltetrahydrofolate synthetase